MAYIFQADIYCDDCGHALCRKFDTAGERPADVEDEHSYDSDEYPKRVGDDDDHGESDTQTHCASGPTCVNAFWVGAFKVGELLGTNLTQDGIQYVVDMIQENPNSDYSRYLHATFGEYYDEIANCIKDTFVVYAGNPFDGASMFGPFDSGDDASQWAESKCDDRDWHVMKLEGPPGYSPSTD